MGVKALPRIAEQLVAGGRPSDEPVAVVERGTLPGPADGRARTLADDRRATPRRRSARRRSRWSATSRRCGRRSRGSSARPLFGAHGRRHPGPRAGLGAGGAAARPGRGGRRGAGDPDAAARRLAARPRRLRPAVRHLARRRRRAVRASCATRASSAGVTGRRDRARDGARAARARRSRPTSCPARASPRAWSRRSPTCRCSRALIARARGGPRRAADALRARGAPWRSLALYETVAEPLSDGSRPPRPPRTTCCSRPARRCASTRGGWFARPDRAWSRSGRRRRTSASLGAEPTRGDRTRRTSRRPIPHDARDGLDRRCMRRRELRLPWPTPPRSRFLSDYGPGDEYVGIVHGVIATIAPAGADHRPRPRRPAAGRPHRRATARQSAALHPSGVHLAVVDPGVGTRAAGRRAARRGDAHPRRARQRPAVAGGGVRDRRGGGDLALPVAARAGLGDVPRARHLRAGDGAPRERRAARGGGRADRRRRRSSGCPCWRRARVSSRWWRSTASATSSPTAELPRGDVRIGGHDGDGRARRSATSRPAGS